MHLTLKKEATKPAGKNFLQQQARFEAFTRVYNHERPHQALNMCLPALEYPFHGREARHSNEEPTRE
jgi:transposase InsO family protein